LSVEMNRNAVSCRQGFFVKRSCEEIVVTFQFAEPCGLE